MNPKLIRLAPIGVVAATTGYFCWSHVSDSVGPKPKPAPKIEALTTANLSPAAPGPLERDPFARPMTAVVTTPEPARESTPESARETAHGSAPDGSPAETGGESRIARQHDEPPQQGFDPREFVLNGAYIRGKSRHAVINGKVYAEGQDLFAGDPPAAVGNITRVAVDRVEVSVGDVRTLLTYAPVDLKGTALASQRPPIALPAPSHPAPSDDALASIAKPLLVPQPMLVGNQTDAAASSPAGKSTSPRGKPANAITPSAIP